MIDKISPREQSGRDSFGRYRAQIRSAAIATFSILEGKEVDRVYCDFQDDFVVRKKIEDKITYLFYQVKTKNKHNHNWKVSDIFGLNSQKKDFSLEKIKKSYWGKLIIHTVTFDGYCEKVIFQTNIHNSDSVMEIFSDLKDGIYSNKICKQLVKGFNQCFGSDYTEEQIKTRMQKFDFETDVEYLKMDNTRFESIAREKVYEFSEIDLDRVETKEIVFKLLNLVEEKSSGIIKDLKAESIEKLAAIAIDDLLSILSISKDAYQLYRDGGDLQAVKSASITQRILSQAGADNSMIEYCSRCKTDWDQWLRKNRHVLGELDFNTITSIISKSYGASKEGSSELDLKVWRLKIQSVLNELLEEDLLCSLTEETVFGAFFSELVRDKS